MVGESEDNIPVGKPIPGRHSDTETDLKGRVSTALI
jgi:hypothetical protein